MARMASMLARAASSALAASRAAASASARAARAAAAAAVSRAARSSTDAAAADLDSGTSSFRCDASRNGRLLGRTRGAAPRLPLGNNSLQSDSCLSPDDEAPVKKKFVANEKDLESDEALWALYERWCKHFNQKRDRDEMARRFKEFKRMVLHVHQVNNSDGPNKLAINMFTDGKLAELCFPDNNAAQQRQIERWANLPKSDSWFHVGKDGKYFIELPPECQPVPYYMEAPAECQQESP